MKNISRLILLIIFVWGLQILPDANAKDAENMEGFPQGPVKEVVKIQYNQNGEERFRTIWNFNQEGLLKESVLNLTDWSLQGVFKWNDSNDIEEAIFYKNGQFDYKQVYKYDDSDQITNHYIGWYESDMAVRFYQYKKTGRLIEDAKYDEQDHLILRTEYFWDENGDRRELRNYNSDNQLTYKVVTDYFKPTQIKEEFAYDKDGNVIRQRLIQYNPQGKVLESIYQNMRDNYTHKLIYEYDEEGHVLEEVFYLNEEIHSSFTYTYSDNFRKYIRNEFDSQDNQVGLEEVTLDDRGNEIETVTERQDQEKYRTVKVYDDQNRRVKTESWRNDQFESSFEIFYGPDGNLLREESYYSSNRNFLSIITYQYDQYGNMTGRTPMKAEGSTFVPVAGEKTIWDYTYYDTSIDDWVVK